MTRSQIRAMVRFWKRQVRRMRSRGGRDEVDLRVVTKAGVVRGECLTLTGVYAWGELFLALEPHELATPEAQSFLAELRRRPVMRAKEFRELVLSHCRGLELRDDEAPPWFPRALDA